MRGGRVVAHLPFSTLGLSIESARLLMIVHIGAAHARGLRCSPAPGEKKAAQSGDLRSMHPADPASHASTQWDELRVWDPGD